MNWWVRPLVRLMAALALPILVPAIITLVVWTLPGTLASTICPPGCAREAREGIVAEYHLQSPYSDGIRASVGLAPLSAVERDQEAEARGEPQYVPEEDMTTEQYLYASGSASLDAGYFLLNWLANAVTLDFGRGKVGTYTAFQIHELVFAALPNTLLLIGAALIPVFGGMLISASTWIPHRKTLMTALWSGSLGGVLILYGLVAWAFGQIDGPPLVVLVTVGVATIVLLFAILSAAGWLPVQNDGLLIGLGIIPAVFLALFVYAVLQIFLGGDPLAFDVPLGGDEFWGLFYSAEALANTEPTTMWCRVQPMALIYGGIALGVADGATSSAVLGTRNLFESEVKQRYIGIAVLRGESVLGNALPNLLPAFIGQLRGRVLHLVSGTVIVELVLQIDGLGDLLWNSTLDKATFVILAAAWGFSLISALLLLLQALSEIGVALLVRRAPSVAMDDAPVEQAEAA